VWLSHVVEAGKGTQFNRPVTGQKLQNGERGHSIESRAVSLDPPQKQERRH